MSARFILIQNHKKIDNMNDSFRAYKDGAILNSALISELIDVMLVRSR